jgi:hypothetical protein
MLSAIRITILIIKDFPFKAFNFYIVIASNYCNNQNLLTLTIYHSHRLKANKKKIKKYQQ